MLITYNFVNYFFRLHQVHLLITFIVVACSYSACYDARRSTASFEWQSLSWFQMQMVLTSFGTSHHIMAAECYIAIAGIKLLTWEWWAEAIALKRLHSQLNSRYCNTHFWDFVPAFSFFTSIFFLLLFSLFASFFQHFLIVLEHKNLITLLFESVVTVMTFMVFCYDLSLFNSRIIALLLWYMDIASNYILKSNKLKFKFNRQNDCTLLKCS